MGSSQSLVHGVSRLGDRANSVLQLDLLEIVAEDRVLEPEFTTLRRIRKAPNRTLSCDRAGVEGELVGEVHIDQDRRCDDDRRRALEVMHDGDEDPRRTCGTMQAPDGIVDEITGEEVAGCALAHDSNALIRATSHVDLGLTWLARIHATDAHLEARTLIRSNPTSRPDGNRHLVLMQRVATEDRLLGNQRTAIVAQAPEYEAVVFEEDGQGEWTREARHGQHLGRGNDHRLRGVNRVGHHIDANRSSRITDTTTPRGIAGVLLDEGALERTADRGVGPRKLNFAHDHRPGRAKARPTRRALRWRETTERSRRAP